MTDNSYMTLAEVSKEMGRRWSGLDEGIKIKLELKVEMAKTEYEE